MSKSDAQYYGWLRGEQRHCLTPGCINPTEELHHVQLLRSKWHSGFAPRRFSPYQVVPLCRACHHAIHSRVGEQVWLDRLGGREGLAAWVVERVTTYMRSHRIAQEALEESEWIQDPFDKLQSLHEALVASQGV